MQRPEIFPAMLMAPTQDEVQEPCGDTWEEVAKKPSQESPSWLEWIGGDTYREAWKAIIRPPRRTYSQDELGPSSFTLHGRKYIRKDLQLKNLRGDVLECSHFLPALHTDARRPCVVYLHGNSSCRLEANELLKELLPRDITLFAFDFSGSGNSGGEYISLGHEEQKDLVVVLRHLRQAGSVTSIALWGYSMGASTAVLRAAKDQCLAACVLDSPFSDLRTVAEELVSQQLSLPKFIVDMALDTVRNEVRNRAGFDPDEIVPLNCVHRAMCPAFFGAAVDDEIVLPHHSEDLHWEWGGVSQLRSFSGGHNGKRPDWFIHEAIDFLVENLHPWAAGFEGVPLASPREETRFSFMKVPPRILAPISSASNLPVLLGEACKAIAEKERSPCHKRTSMEEPSSSSTASPRQSASSALASRVCLDSQTVDRSGNRFGPAL